MLRNENIKNLSELNQAFVDKHKMAEFFLGFIDILKLGKFHAIFSSAKTKSIAPALLIRILITFPFIDLKNLYSFINSYWNNIFNYGKDVYYMQNNNKKINWRSFFCCYKTTAPYIIKTANHQNNPFNSENAKEKL